MSDPRGGLLVSILNWNGTDDTLECLAQLMPDLLPDMHVVVFDNGSTVDPTPLITTRFPAVEVRREPVNLGFTGGHNAVMQMALERGFDAVLLLNNDCRLDIAAIVAMRESMVADERVAAVSPLIYNDDAERRPQMVGGWIDWPRHRSVQPSVPSFPVPAGAPVHVLGTALLLRSAALRRIGLLNDRLFAYYEDNDLSARIAAAGYIARYCDAAVATHRHRTIGEVSALSLFLSARNAWLFWREHTPLAHRPRLTRDLLSQQLADIAQLQADGVAIDRQHAVVDGMWQGLRGRSGPPPARRDSPPWLRRIALAAPYLLSQLIADPLAAIRARVARVFARGKATPAP